MGASIGAIRGVMGETLATRGLNAQALVAHDGARVSLGYAVAMLNEPNALPPVVGVAARIAASHGWGARGTQEIGGLRVGPEIEVVALWLKVQAGLGQHVGGRHGAAHSFYWSVGAGF